MRLRRPMVLLAVAAAAAAVLLGLAATPAAASRAVIAWVPSHQNDTGTQPWHEYVICGDITQRTMALLPDFTNVLCWETGMGLTSSNVPALQSEVDQANAAGADYLISVHVDAGAPSGVLGVYFTGDTASARYAASLMKAVAATMGMTYRGLYSSTFYLLNPDRNFVPIRVILELGDNVADRQLLLSESGRQRMAEALAKAVRELTPPPTDPIRYEQNDFRLSYTGTWNSTSTALAFDGSFRYSNTSGSSVTATFKGTSLAWIAKMSPVYGRARVTVDGGAPQTVDLYAPAEQWRAKVWETGILDPGTHTVNIAWTGTKSSAATATNISVDAFEVTGVLTKADAPPPPPPPALTRYEQTSGKIVYSGPWTTFTATEASGGTYTYADAAATATIWFSGTRLDWIATTGTTQGKAEVVLDGGAPVTVDLYSPSTLRQQTAWSTGDLADGTHTLTVSWTGQRSVSTGGTRVNIDAVDVKGTLVQAPAPARYEQNHSRLVYTGTWTPSYTSYASGGSFRFSNTCGSSVTATFDGTSLTWIAKKSSVYGKAKVSLDGGAPQTVDLYSYATKWKQRVWTTGVLDAGLHTVRIEWTGTKSSAATATNINLDALEVMGTLEPPPAPPAPPTVTRYEQTSDKIVYTGTWLDFTASGASGGNYKYADSPATASVSFTGTQLDWIATKGYTQGRAALSLDGGAPVVVDLYNPTTERQVTVWSSGTLDPGTHTLVITWLGERSVSTGGTRINIDALDVLGVLD